VQSSTIIDLGRFSLSYGDGKRLDLPVSIGPVELGGQTYLLSPESTQVRLDISRPAHGYAFRMRFPVRVDGPCMRCLEQATVASEVDAREVDQRSTDDEELQSPYVNDDNKLDLGRWAHDAAVLALPTRILCRPDCAGLCPVCGESLNDTDPADHEHDTTPDPRWAKLNELKLD
jgi:DUF177 domain-containing protein